MLRTISQPPPAVTPRTMAEIIDDAQPCDCGHCWARPGVPCATGSPGGGHVARLARAVRRGRVTDNTHVRDQVLAVLAAAGTPMSTPDLQVATGYSPRYGQLVYNTLARLAAAGQVEKITTRGVKPAFWRRLAP